MSTSNTGLVALFFFLRPRLNLFIKLSKVSTRLLTWLPGGPGGSTGCPLVAGHVKENMNDKAGSSVYLSAVTQPGCRVKLFLRRSVVHGKTKIDSA